LGSGDAGERDHSGGEACKAWEEAEVKRREVITGMLGAVGKPSFQRASAKMDAAAKLQTEIAEKKDLARVGELCKAYDEILAAIR
jgi:hypothetical protein